LQASARLPGLRRPKLALYALCQADEAARMSNWFPLLNPEKKQALLSEPIQHALSPALTASLFGQHLARSQTAIPLHRMLYVDTKLWLPDNLLARGDKMSMAASIEARVPLLDHKLVEFAAALPPHLKVRGLTRKYLLKKVSRAWLPSQIIDRKKQGFPVPLSHWFRHEARPFMRDILSSASVRQRGLFNVSYTEKLLDEHDTGFADHSAVIWGLLGVELWHRLFIDTRSPLRS